MVTLCFQKTFLNSSINSNLGSNHRRHLNIFSSFELWLKVNIANLKRSRNQIPIKRKIKKVNSVELNYLLDISGHSDFAFFLEINHKGVFFFCDVWNMLLLFLRVMPRCQITQKEYLNHFNYFNIPQIDVIHL